MMKNILIFAIIFYISCQFKESLGCGYQKCKTCTNCHISRCPPSWFGKIGVTIEWENDTPDPDDCEVGSPCKKHTDCGENGTCYHNPFLFIEFG